MKRVTLTLLLLTASLTWSQAVWKTVPEPPQPPPPRTMCGLMTKNLTCTIELKQPIQAGDALTLMFNNSSDSNAAAQRFLLWVADCNDPTGCTPETSINQWDLHHSPGDDCRGFVTGNDTFSTDCATAVPSLPGATYITFTRNDTGAAETFDGAFFELSNPAGPVLESVAGDSEPATKTPIMTPTIVTGNDATIQSITSAPSAISPPYVGFFAAHYAWGYALGVKNGLPADWKNSIKMPAAGSAVSWTTNPIGARSH